MNAPQSLLKKALSFFKSATVSYSKIAAYGFCPFKYKLIYVNGWKIPPNPYISMGLTVHGALDDYHRRHGNSLGELESFYDERWVNLGFADPVESLEFYESGKRMLADFFAWDSSRRAAGIRTIFSEKEFAFRLGRHRVIGIIDRVDSLPDGGCEIIDYKTHREAWTRERLDSDMQLPLYAAGLKKSAGIKPSKLSYYFIYRNEYVATERSAADEKKTLAAASAAGNAIAAGEFPPRAGACAKCDFKDKCPRSSFRGERGDI